VGDVVQGGPRVAPRGTIGPFTPGQILSSYAISGTGIGWSSGGTWPAANRALYLPFQVEAPITVTKIAVQVTVQSGNCDVGIYDYWAARLVSMGSTAVAAAGMQVFDIADTTLRPGYYWVAMNVDNTTAAFNRATPVAQSLRTLAVREQAVGAVALPNPATMANPSSAYIPWVAMAVRSTF
jgi:hypothetical protein